MNIPNHIDVAVLERSIKDSKPAITYAALKAMCDGDETLELCLKDFVDCALRYTETVCKFKLIVIQYSGTNEGGMLAEIDKVRTTSHDALIVSTKVLSRTMGKFGKCNAWYDQVGANRASIGRFAIIESLEILKAMKEVPNEP